MVLIFIIILSIACTQLGWADKIHLNLDANNFINYPIFDGIGAISGGGATSKLLLTYKEPFRSQILDYLFKPQFGASLQMLKVEIGGDSQSTEGTEASHSHYQGEVNCHRGYEWPLIAEAKKRNPDILLYGLPWAFPGWIGNYTQNPYVLPYQLAYYIINWLRCARNTYHFEFQYIGIWNEKRYNVKYIKTLRQVLDKEGFSNVQIIASDNKWEISAAILSDTVLAKSIHAIGCHYPGTLSTNLAKKTGKRLWSSEDYSTMNTETGPGCWARILNQNFVNGNMTSTIAWNLIAAYYDDLPYGRCGLMTAIEPWSGHYEVPATIWITAHTTQFTRPGWKYCSVGFGSGHLIYGGSYVTISDFDSELRNVTIVLESLTHDNSLCIRPALPPYKVQDQNVTIKFNSAVIERFKKFYVWRTDLSGKRPSKVFQLEGIFTPDPNGEINITMPKDNVVTVTTVDSARKGAHDTPPTPMPFPSEYQDNFEKYPLNSEPDLLSPQVGSFEVVNLTSASKVLLQTVIDQPIQWCFSSPLNVRPVAVIGNFNKSDLMFSMSVMLPSVKAANAIFIGARINNSGCTTFLAGGVFFWLNFTSSELIISSDFKATRQYIRQNTNLKISQWYNMSFVLKEDIGWFYINDVLATEIKGLYNKSPIHGFAGIGTDKFGFAYFDNLKMKIL